MKSLLLVAHGSRRAASNEEVAELVDRLKLRESGEFDAIGYAFLELAEPSIPAGIEDMVAKGMQNIVVLPYFLSAGAHVAVDIPKIIEQKQSDHPNITIQLMPHIGASEQMLELLLQATR